MKIFIYLALATTYIVVYLYIVVYIYGCLQMWLFTNVVYIYGCLRVWLFTQIVDYLLVVYIYNC